MVWKSNPFLKIFIGLLVTLLLSVGASAAFRRGSVLLSRFAPAILHTLITEDFSVATHFLKRVRDEHEFPSLYPSIGKVTPEMLVGPMMWTEGRLWDFAKVRRSGGSEYEALSGVEKRLWLKMLLLVSSDLRRLRALGAFAPPSGVRMVRFIDWDGLPGPHKEMLDEGKIYSPGTLTSTSLLTSVTLSKLETHYSCRTLLASMSRNHRNLLR